MSDLGSGLNCKKPGLKKLLEAIWSGTVSSLTLTHADRLLRFGKELVFYRCKQFNVSIQILDDPEGEAFETELVKDVITLMTVFSAHLYGKRSWKNRRALEQTQPNSMPTGN
ncbi:recombinase family protein [Turicimonas muris]|uniref:recombinase family protein n=2 Tax=Turicimonas muris TaxID=1796652 RepID=UPI001916F0BE|nr:recombinase family protein [Turicimonas muris]